MADNILVSDSTTTNSKIPDASIFRLDDVGGVLYQVVKLDVGGDGVSSPVTSLAKETGGNLETVVTDLGTVTEAAPATDTASSGLNGRLQRIAQRLTTIIAQLPAALGAGGGLKVDGSGTALPISGTVTTGGLTDTQLRAVAVPVSGTVTASGPLTDTELRATAVPVSGTVTASGPLTDTELRAAAVPVTPPQTTTTLFDAVSNVAAVPTNTAISAVLYSPSLPYLYNGTTWDRTRGDVTNGLDVDVTRLPAEVGALTETAPATDTASSGLNGRLQRIAQRLTTLLAVFPTTIDTNSGNKSASTLRVVLATDQPALTNKLLVTPDSVALPANQSVNVAQVNGVAPLMGAGNTGTGSPRVTIASDQATLPVSLASVPAHAVTNAGTFAAQIDGAALTALQLIDDVVLAEDAVHASGDKGVMALAVRKDTAAALAGTDGDYIPFSTDASGNLRTVASVPTGTAALTNVNDQATSISLLASNTSRKGAIIHNDSISDLYVKFGATASLTSYTYKLYPGDHLEFPLPIYTGAVDGIWSADSTGAARMTEIT